MSSHDRALVELADRTPPHNLDAEMAVLGSMMVSTRAVDEVVTALKGEDFYSPAHQEVFHAICQLHATGKAPDLVTVTDELNRRETLERVGGTAALISIIESVPTAANAEAYAEVVRDYATLRNLEMAGQEIVKIVRDPDTDITDKLNLAQDAIYKAGQHRLGSEFQSVGDLAMRFFEKVDRLMETGEPIQGLLTGNPDLDDMNHGFFPGELTILAARPAMGKTSMAMSFALAAARKSAGKVAFFSLEMSGEQLVRRLMAVESRVSMGRLSGSNKIEEEDYQKLVDACETLYGMQVYIDDTSDLTPAQLRAKCRRLNAEGDLQLVVVDYLQLMRSGLRTENRNTEISEIARGLKRVAKDLGLPVIALSQVNRAVESRENKRPMLSDLRESGSIEAEADLVMFLYRDRYYKRREQGMDEQEGEAPNEVAELIIAKHRNGPVGMVMYAFEPSFTRFSALDDQGKQDYLESLRGGGYED